jgi:hypothetical protein
MGPGLRHGSSPWAEGPRGDERGGENRILSHALSCSGSGWRSRMYPRKAGVVRGSAHEVVSVAWASGDGATKRAQQLCGVLGVSHEMGNVAEAEAVENVEGNTCGLSVQEASSRRGRRRHHARKDHVGSIRQPIGLYSPTGDQPRGVRIDKRPSAISISTRRRVNSLWLIVITG